MNSNASLTSKNWAEINAIKKQCVVQKFNRLARGRAFLLFFHYNGSKVYNWELLKKKVSERGINCKGLFVPSNLHSVILEKSVIDCAKGYAPGNAEGTVDRRRGLKKKVVTNVIRDNQGHLSEWRFLMRGPTLIVGCSSTEQMSAIVEICTFPTFYCMGGLYKNNVLTHLDIKQWIFLHQLGDKKLNGTFLSLLLYQKKQSVGVFVFYQTLAIHSILQRNLTPLFLLLGHKNAGASQ